MRITYCTILLLVSLIATAQKFEYATSLIPDTLTANANAVVRFDLTDINITSQRNMIITTKRVVTVLNEKGQRAIDAFENYDKKRTVRNIEATVYDAFGNELKKIKRKDFRDQTAVDNATMFSDSRIIYLDYTPVQYPFTVVYESTIETSNTAFIPRWFALNDYFMSVQKSILNVAVAQNLGFKKKEFNFNGYTVESAAGTPTSISYIASNIPAIRREDYSPGMAEVFPHLMMGLELFHLEGVDGNAKTWTDFGLWYSDKILAGTTKLPEETKSKIISLVGTETDPIKKARIIYDYVQQKSRYVSIQVGIGGWKPMAAADVDRLGYGDCKALTNYTKALLECVGVPSYNTILFGGSSKDDIQADFVSMQGNHMILSIPDNNGYIWLECTSQTDPFGYQGTFTDDRTVLVIAPDGAQIARTTDYGDKTNRQVSTGRFSINTAGDLEGTVQIVSNGTQYSHKFGLARLPGFERDAHYKDYWRSIGNLKIEEVNFQDDRNNIRFTESAKIKAAEYGKLSSNRMLFVVNAYNRINNVPGKVKNRRTPFELERGFLDSDEIEIVIPDGFSIEALPGKMQIATKFGEYSAEIITTADSKLIYRRSLFIKKGRYASSEYEDYRQFMERIAKSDNSKMVLVKTL